MKTQIIQLETHDDAVSVRDKMGWGQASRILLIWPPGGENLNRRLDLALLQRHSMIMGAQIALVTTDPDVRFHARDLKIPVFKNIQKAQSSPWRVGRGRPRRIQRQSPRPDLEEMRRLVHPPAPPWYAGPFARRSYYVFTLLVFLAALGVLSPAAFISLQPETRQQRVTLTASASTDTSIPSLSGALPARVQSVVVEGRSELLTSGRVWVPEKAASGRVQFTNLTDRSIQIPQGTVVSYTPQEGAQAIRFTTTRTVQVSAGPGRTISAPVEALQPGRESNLPARRLNTIEGLLGLNLSVTNLQAISGGSSREAASPSGVDYVYLKDELLDTLHEAALMEALAILPPGSHVISSTLVLADVLEQIYDPPEPSEGSQAPPSERLALTMRGEFEVLVISGDDLRTLVINVLDASLPEGFTALPEGPVIDDLGEPTLEEGSVYRWRVRAERSISALVSKEEAVQAALGLPPEEATLVLEKSFSLAGSPQIVINPPWWPRLPLLPFRLAVQIGSP
jgi:hypothetical protein